MAQTTLFSREQIQVRVAEMAKQISADLCGSELIALCGLKGAVVFCTDLVRNLPVDRALDFDQIHSHLKQQ